MSAVDVESARAMLAQIDANQPTEPEQPETVQREAYTLIPHHPADIEEDGDALVQPVPAADGGNLLGRRFSPREIDAVIHDDIVAPVAEASEVFAGVPELLPVVEPYERLVHENAQDEIEQLQQAPGDIHIFLQSAPYRHLLATVL